MAGQLRVVVPPEAPGVFRRAYAAFATAGAARWLSRKVSWRLDPILLRATGGHLASTLVFRAAVLETRGARTGVLRRNAIIYFHDGERVTIVASNAGADRHPSWYHNLLAHPAVAFGGHPMRAVVITDEQERDRLEGLSDRAFPAFARYRSRAAETGRVVPIIQLLPAD